MKRPLLMLLAVAPMMAPIASPIASAQPGVTSPATPSPSSPAKPLPPQPLPPPSAGSGSAAAAGSGSAEPPVDWLLGVTDLNSTAKTEGEVQLSLDRAIDIAIKTQPTLREARATAEAAYGRVDLAEVARHPTVSASAGAEYTSSALCNTALVGSGSNASTVTLNAGPCGGFFHPTFSGSLGASAAWRLSDFGLTGANIASAELAAESSEKLVESSAMDIRLNVESAYLAAVARRRLVVVAAATVKSEEQHLDQAKRFVAAQAQDPIQVAQAQTRYENARAALSQAQSDEATALANLRAAIGYVELKGAIVVDPNWPVPPAEDPPALGALIDAAKKHRPELVAAELTLESADAAITAASDERNPILSAAASTSWTPAQGNWDPQPGWLVGLTLSWAVWDGGKSRADTRVAHANYDNDLAQRDALLVSITSTLDQARAQILTNRAAVASSLEAVTAARIQLNLSDQRYKQGLGSQIELADAQTAVTTAEGNLVLSEFNLATAWAQLRRALGAYN